MEIIDDRYENLARIHVPTLIADDTLDAGIILGEPCSDWRKLALANLEGRSLIKGEFVSTGSIADIVWAKRGDRIVAAVDQLGSVEAHFL